MLAPFPIAIESMRCHGGSIMTGLLLFTGLIELSVRAGLSSAAVLYRRVRLGQAKAGSFSQVPPFHGHGNSVRLRRALTDVLGATWQATCTR